MWLSRKTSGGWVVSASALGTGGELGRHPEGFSRLGVLEDTWHSPKVRPKGLSVWLSGHVALSDGFRRGLSSGLRGSIRDTWHSPKVSPKGFRWRLRRGFRQGFRMAPKGFSRSG